jgi:hypothetical protein
MTGFAGFDRSDPLTPDQFDWLQKNSDAKWVGGYLPSPSHGARTWCGLWQGLKAKGWGVAPVYVGRQVMGPGSHAVTAANGTLDGQDAAAQMTTEGFAPGSFVYLDHESPSQEFITSGYTAAWIDAVQAAGFGAGLYGSFLQGAQFAALRPNVRVWVYRVPTVARTTYPNDTFPELDPASSGFPGAFAWQLRDNIAIPDAAAPGGWLVVDLDSALSADPSAA